MRTAVILAALTLAACGERVENSQANMAAPVEAGHDETPPAQPPAVEPLPAPVPPAEVAPDADSGEAAAGVARDYYARIARGDYRGAWALWEDSGEASGMSADAFAASFDKYVEYRATVGTPGRVDAGAGQRYVTIPVKIEGRLRDGDRPFAMAGDLILHKTADIPGATTEQRSWRIRESAIRPQP